jgi:outer membrane protein assembly factor BamB
MWESEWVQGYGDDRNPQKIGNHVYQQFESGYVLVLNDSDGTRAATIRMGETEDEADSYAAWMNDHFAALDRYLYWGNRAHLLEIEQGLMRLDTTTIDFNTDPYTVQVIIPELAWSKSWETEVDTIISENGIIYFLTSSFVDNTHTPLLAALDAETAQVIWERTIPFNNSLFINGDKLFVAESSLSCHNKFTGEVLYEVPVLDSLPYSWRITAHDNFLYGNDNTDSIVCIDSNTGKKAWSRSIYTHHDDYSEQHEYNSYPQVYGEKLYMASDTGLRVYKAVNGNFIGVDDSFVKETEIWYTLMYNDILVCICGVGYGSLYLIAIKCQ